MFKINDVVMIKQSKAVLNYKVGCTGIVVMVYNKYVFDNNACFVNFEDDSRMLYLNCDLINVSKEVNCNEISYKPNYKNDRHFR